MQQLNRSILTASGPLAINPEIMVRYTDWQDDHAEDCQYCSKIEHLEGRKLQSSKQARIGVE